MADIDLRAEVLAGIDQRIRDVVKFDHPSTLTDIATTALRHLREIVEMHRFVPDDDETEGGDWCDECAVTWPCPFLLSLAPDYAPQAWAARQRAIECPCSCHNESNVGLCEDCSDRHAPQALAQMEVNRARPCSL